MPQMKNRILKYIQRILRNELVVSPLRREYIYRKQIEYQQTIAKRRNSNVNQNEGSPSQVPQSREESTKQVTTTRVEKGSNALEPSTREVLFFPTTRSIVLLADLMVAATKKDFALKAASKEPLTLTLVKYPKSFQATIVQTTNKGYDAFNEAQKTMAQLVLLTTRAVALAGEGLNLLEEGEPVDIQDFLPITLGEINDIYEKAATMTATVVANYEGIVQLIREILKCKIKNKKHTKDLLPETEKEMDTVKTQWGNLPSFFLQIVGTIKDTNNTMKEFATIVEQEKAELTEKRITELDKDDATGGVKNTTVGEEAMIEESAASAPEIIIDNAAGDDVVDDDAEESIVRPESELVKAKKVIFTRDIEKISNISSKIRETAVIYSEISQQYLMKCILSLNDLAAMNPKKDSASIVVAQKTIQQDCLQADQAISRQKV